MSSDNIEVVEIDSETLLRWANMMKFIAKQVGEFIPQAISDKPELIAEVTEDAELMMEVASELLVAKAKEIEQVKVLLS